MESTQLKLSATVTAKVMLGRMLDDPPRWGIDTNTIKVGSYKSGTDHEEHLLNTVGSRSWLWSQSDELRFGKDNGILSSALMYVPEANHTTGMGNPEPGSWLDAEPVTGTLRIETLGDFVLERRVARYLIADRHALLCLWDGAASSEIFRLRVATDFDLIFTKRMLSGWLLSRPAQYLVSSWEKPFRSPPSERLIEFLREYLDVVAEPNLEKMEEGDNDLHDVLLGMRERLVNELASDERSRILARRIEDVLQTFYSPKE